jgi:phosphonoacetaldehyde hydrolase
MSDAIQAVVFDWAGTMVDFGSCAPVEALIVVFAGEGVAIDASDARRDMGRAKRDHIAAMLDHPKMRAAWVAAKGAPPSPGDVDRLMEAMVPLMPGLATQRADLIPGVAEVVAGLRAKGVKIGSGTGYSREMMQGVLRRAAEQGYAPDLVVCAGETPAGRPAPLMTWKALVELGAWPAAACVKVDDAEVGIMEGVAAGVWAVGVAASGNGVGLDLAAYRALPEAERRARVVAAGRSLTDAGAHIVVDTVAELPGALEQIAGQIVSGAAPHRLD